MELSMYHGTFLYRGNVLVFIGTGRPPKVANPQKPLRKPIKSHNKLNWLAGLDDKTRISFLETIDGKYNLCPG